MVALNQTSELWTSRLVMAQAPVDGGDGPTPDCCWLICNICCWLLC